MGLSSFQSIGGIAVSIFLVALLCWLHHSFVRLPLGRMNPHSTFIYNFILAGGTGPVNVTGETMDHGVIKRVG
jgi:hypothetical protein